MESENYWTSSGNGLPPLFENVLCINTTFCQSQQLPRDFKEMTIVPCYICNCISVLPDPQGWDSTTTIDQSETASEAPSTTPCSEAPLPLKTPRAKGGVRKHEFLAKTVHIVIIVFACTLFLGFTYYYFFNSIGKIFLSHN